MDGRPPEFFDHLTTITFWVKTSNNKGPYAYCAFNMDGRGSAAVHYHSLRWSSGVAKSLPVDWEVMKGFLKANNCKKIVASYADIEDTRWPKFIKHLGFPEPQLIALSVQEI